MFGFRKMALQGVNMFRKLTSIIVLSLAFAGIANADAFDDALADYNAGNYKAAVAGFKPLANQGLAKAQSKLGVMYKTGQGVPQDDKQAVAWSRKAADQGYARAQTNLGYMYKTGQGVPQDDKQAVAWWRKAADQGYARAQTNLGVMYKDGLGVQQDDKQAVMWFRKAADQGDADAQNRLDAMYANGYGVPEDDATAMNKVVTVIFFLYLLYFIAFIFVFLLPTIIAVKKNHPHKTLIILVNIVGSLFVGIGWLVALVWCFIPPDAVSQGIKKAKQIENVADEIEKLHALKEKGVITEEEFKSKKNQLIGTKNS